MFNHFVEFLFSNLFFCIAFSFALNHTIFFYLFLSLCTNDSVRNVQSQFVQGSEDSTYLQGAGSRPREIKRGLNEFHIEDGEPEKIDHVLFLVHGIGSVCDLKFRTVEEVGTFDYFHQVIIQNIVLYA